jgi:nicotinate phosphoribosyltransferase
MLDEAGLTQCRIVASNSLDETLIRDLLLQGAQRGRVRGGGAPHHSQKRAGVWRRVQAGGRGRRGREGFIPRIKVSDNVGKIPTPACQEGISPV